jgi:FKBP-type peptidyl-prolyl cis-trans isomerase FkpA
MIEYKIIPGKEGRQIKYGDIVRYRNVKYYDDSVLTSPYDAIPQIVFIDSARADWSYIQILQHAKENDSIVTRVSVDSLTKLNQPLPSFAKAGKYVGFRIKIMSIIDDRVTADVMMSDQVKQKAKIDSLLEEKQNLTNNKTIDSFLKSKNISAGKTALGTYVAIEEEGKGEKIRSGDSVSIIFTATTLNGKLFSSTYDTAAKVQRPFNFKVDDVSMLKGVNDGIKYFSNGGKGKLFIPSALAFGMKGSAYVYPNECVVFNIERVTVKRRLR